MVRKFKLILPVAEVRWITAQACLIGCIRPNRFLYRLINTLPDYKSDSEGQLKARSRYLSKTDFGHSDEYSLVISGISP
jgi:hypothetical protein